MLMLNRELIRNILGKLVASLLILVTGLAMFIAYAMYSIEIKEDKVFLIDKNNGLRGISRSLSEQKVVDRPVTFLFFAKLYCELYNKKIIPGEYSLKSGSKVLDIMRILTEGKVVQHRITIPEGFTVKQVVERLRKLNNITHFPDKLNIVKEGTLLPETYFYTYGTFDIDIIKRMQKTMNNFIAIEWLNRDKNIDQIINSPEEAIILASIVEKETYIESERPLIAGVYLNRLKKNMRLQACPTVIYGLNLIESSNWKGRVLYSHLKSDSQYNTYRHKGLPPTPICNPGKKSILAVLHPRWTQKLFFVHEKNGKHAFANDFDEHKKNIKLVKQKGADL